MMVTIIVIKCFKSDTNADDFTTDEEKYQRI